jgi:uncharacterized protein involved in outer membrane biogenesis
VRTVRKIALIAGGLLIVAVMVPALFALLRQEQVTAALTRKVNESVNTKISFGSLRITVFESFPDITARFSDLLVEPSHYYNRAQFRNENNDTLLYASRLSLNVSLPSLLTGTVAVKSISARDGMINLLTDRRGDINYEVFTEKKEKGKDVRLKNISAVNFRVVYNNLSSAIRVSGTTGTANLGGEIFSTGIYLNTTLKARIDSLNMRGTTLRDIPMEADIKLRKSANSLSVARGSFSIADLRFDITGNVNYSSSSLNLVIEGKKISIASLVSRLPEKWGSYTGSFSPSGIIDLKCSLTGPYGEAGTPHLEVDYGLSGGRMSHSSSGFRVNDLQFNGKLTNGERNSAETFRFTMDNLTARYGSASVTGSFMINNLERPHVTLMLDGDLDFDDLGRIFRAGLIEDQTGTVSGSLRLSGTIPDSLRLVEALPFLKPELSLAFSDFGAGIAGNKMAVSAVNGSLTVKNDLLADSLSFTVLDQHFTLNGTMRNFIPWLSGRPSILEITGDVHADRLITSKFTSTRTDTAGNDGKSRDFFLKDVKADVNLSADSLVFNNFRAAGFRSRMTYQPYVINFGDVTAKGLSGDLSGEFMLGKQKDGGYITRARLDVRNIDINQTFASFNNFGQDFIVSDNLYGRVTGNVTLLSPLDNNYKVLSKAVVAEAHLQISEGRLAGFAPAESLSSYLDLDELKNISFSRMENDLFITGGTVSIPKMLINSTAVNFTVFGTHSFNGDYTYHVRLLLSEVLSRKARERNRNDDSFGQVKVDGSGKATVPLKIESINGKTNVSYDFSQAQDNLKADIAVEKQSLKGILNEEYGWYETDTTRIRPAETKPKFSVTWEEGKEQPAATESRQEEVKESPLKILLKKKR